MVGTSHPMQVVKRNALLAAHVNPNVLITGERGVGKASLARFIHDHGERSLYGFCRVNCFGVSDLRLESLLFGHVQGSLSGADEDNPGLLESIPGGTLLLLNVDALSSQMQDRLLRFLETGEYQRVGAKPVRTHLGVRVIATTTEDLSVLAADGLFLNGLYRRLAGIRLTVPPLRDRRDDIPSLVDYFAAELAGCDALGAGAPDALISSVIRIAMSRDEWPGNVAELRNVVEGQLMGVFRPVTHSIRVVPPHHRLVH
jgi:NtrC-family two-component system response regulator AlgB